MTFPIYTGLYTAAAFLAAPVYLVRGLRHGKYLWSLRSRLGLAPPVIASGSKTGPRVWVHALSLGEVTSAAPLIKGLEDRGFQVVLSTTTRSGHEAALKKYTGRPLFSPPLDLPGAVQKVIRAVDPDLFVLVETDIWPNLLAGLRAQGVPAILVSHRLSPRSRAGYGRMKSFWKRVLDHFQAIGCQSEEDRDRVAWFGVDSGRLAVTGNLKFDAPPVDTGPEARACLLAETGLAQGPWIVGGSTHPGEEAMLLDILGRLAPRFPGLGLVIAPRDVGRADSIWRLIQASGFPAARRTEPSAGLETRVYLLDTLGELDRFYELADFVFMGKSLTPLGEGGGQNLLEPALRAKPMLHGPRMHNFAEIARIMTQAGGAVQVNSPEELQNQAARLLGDPAAARAMGQKAQAAIAPHRGAAEKTLALVDQALAGRKG